MKRYYIRVTQSIKNGNASVKQKALIPLKRSMMVVKQALAQETRETKVMLSTYQQFTRGRASKLEMEAANKQFLDVLRGLGLGVLAVLPFSPITLPFVVKLGQKVGVNVLPSSFLTTSREANGIDIQQEIELIELIVESDTTIKHDDDRC